MAQTGSIVTAQVLSLLTDSGGGINSTLAEISADAGVTLAPLGAAQIVGQNVTAEIAEKTAGAMYPAMYVYCDKVSNTLKEKFRTFSGKAQVAIEARVSQDRLEGIDQQMQLYVDAITQVLDANRGDWGQGMFYTGGYEVAFGPVKHGGRNFLQAGKVTLEVDISC
jgi:hypothetical protein